MKILVVGSEGFLGRNVAQELERHHEVFRGVRVGADKQSRRVEIDLGSKDSVRAVLRDVRPEVIVNCAGIVDPSADVSQNQLFTKHILESVVEESVKVEKVVLSGSAGEYGLVDSINLPIKEDATLAAASDYGMSKVQEVEFAKEFAKQHSLDVVEARIFNPIGPGMHDKFLITRILKQIREVEVGSRQELEINRLDATRDYIDVRDVARAIRALIEVPTRYNEYNIGSGKATTNRELIDRVLRFAGSDHRIAVREISATPEPGVASAADITRISSDTKWRPRMTLDETIQDIVKEAGK